MHTTTKHENCDYSSTENVRLHYPAGGHVDLDVVPMRATNTAPPSRCFVSRSALLSRTSRLVLKRSNCLEKPETVLTVPYFADIKFDIE